MFQGIVYLEEMKTNVYLVPERIREIDSRYRVVRNLMTGQYELHHMGQKEKTGNSFCLVLPFEELDCRAVEFVNKTAIRNRNLQREFRQMEEENEKKRLKKESEEKDQLNRESVEILKYCDRHSKDWID